MISMKRWTMHITPTLCRAGTIAAIVLALGCPSDDTVRDDGSGSGGSGVGPSTGSGSTQGATSTSSASGSSTESSAASSTDATAADSTGMDPPAGSCACAPGFPARDFCYVEDLAEWVPGCPQEQPCSRVTVTCPRPNQDLYDCSSELVFDEAAMQCMLETLRDGTPARLEIDGLLDYGISSGQSLHLVHVLEGRTAVRAACINVDVGAETFDPTSHVLTDADYFTACIEAATPLARYECMMDGLLGEGTTLPVCPD
jgi:hypothetical protein